MPPTIGHEIRNLGALQLPLCDFFRLLSAADLSCFFYGAGDIEVFLVEKADVLDPVLFL